MAFSHPLPPPPLCSPELQTGACTPLAATRSPSDLSYGDPAPPQHFPALTTVVSPALGTISLLPSAEAPPQPRSPWCLLPGQVLSWHTAHGTQHTRALTILGIYGASHPRRITSSCSRNSQKLRGAPGTPICSVSSVGCASSYCPLAPAAYQRPDSTQPLSLATGAFT